MANRSYLVLTNNETIYPSETDQSFSPELQTVACGIHCVPLLWLALFRPEDLRTQVLSVGDGELDFTAPLVRTGVAIKQLRSAAPVLEEMFAQNGGLGDYLSLLEDAVQMHAREFVTVELAEIEVPEVYLKYALGSFSGDVPTGVGRTSLLHIAELGGTTKFPAAKRIEGVEVSRDDSMVHSHIIGCSWVRAVPWELD